MTTNLTIENSHDVARLLGTADTQSIESTTTRTQALTWCYLNDDFDGIVERLSAIQADASVTRTYNAQLQKVGKALHAENDTVQVRAVRPIKDKKLIVGYEIGLPDSREGRKKNPKTTDNALLAAFADVVEFQAKGYDCDEWLDLIKQSVEALRSQETVDRKPVTFQIDGPTVRIGLES